MRLDEAALERTLGNRLCACVRIHRRDDGVVMLDTPFTFPDGDHYAIYLSETPSGGVLLSDRGHTLMQVSYEYDVDAFYEAPRAALRERIVREAGIKEHDGVFSVETAPDQVADAAFRLGQALTKVCDLAFVGSVRPSLTFCDDHA